MEAWQAREYEQQKFIEGLARKVRDKAQESEGSYYPFIMHFLSCLLQRLVVPQRAMVPLDKRWRHSATDLILDNLIPDIDQFARVESEKPYLLYLLFEQLQPSIRDWANRDYIREQLANPEKVFGASSATTEVELP